jgi:hypothetical protein
MRMHKKTSRDNSKDSRNYSQGAKKEIVWGMGKNAALWVYIASVGPPSGWCNNVVRMRAALGTCGQVARVQTGNITVRPKDAARVRTQVGPVRTIGLHSRPDSKRVPSRLLIRPDAKRDRLDTPHGNIRKLRKIHRNQIFSKSVSEHACINH